MKILYLGNSLTLHGPNAEIGWHGNWGMAASCAENDYVHQLASILERNGIHTEIRFLNIADFERNPGTYDLEILRGERDWKPDAVVLRICENTGADAMDEFGTAYRKLIRYFRNSEKKPYIYAAMPLR